jgi:folate-binding protein YgfZ
MLISLQLKVDTTTGFLPVAITRWFGTSRATDLDRAQSNRRLGVCCRNRCQFERWLNNGHSSFGQVRRHLYSVPELSALSQQPVTMTKPIVEPGTGALPAAGYGYLQVSGADTRQFLQGQLSHDVARLDSTRSLRAGLHNPQGRVLAILRLCIDASAVAPDTVYAVLPQELRDPVAAQLKKYVLRAKVQIDTFASVDSVRLASLVAPASIEIAAGLPEVYASTQGALVAQMLNLDCIDAIDWNKGCYTGQEIIARTHYRGRVKRRMRRFAGSGDAPPAPGTIHRTSDGIDTTVVRSAVTGAGRFEWLGVVALDTRSADELPVPYALPD